MPATSGQGIRATTGRRSNQPGVTASGPSASVWYQAGFEAMRSLRSKAATLRGPALGGAQQQRLVARADRLPIPLPRMRAARLPDIAEIEDLLERLHERVEVVGCEQPADVG